MAKRSRKAKARRAAAAPRAPDLATSATGPASAAEATPAAAPPADAAPDAAPQGTARRLLGRLACVAVGVPFVLGVLVTLEFIKDDAYISFRYAHNLVHGAGLVFNPGERVEGFTNFAWVLLLAPFEALGWDLFQVCEVLGTALGLACLVVTARLTALAGARSPAHLWGAFWLSTSSSLALWAKSGLEQPLATLLPALGALLLFRARDRSDARGHLVAGLVLGLGCITRPELHLLAVIVGLPLVVDAVRARRVARAPLLYVAGILAITVPAHAFRFLYYGSLVPNTFYVKTGSGSAVWAVGLSTLGDMLSFDLTWLLVLLAPLALVRGPRRLERITMAIVAVSFMAYYVAVGIDEMQWHRLYLPALPFLCVLAALGVDALVGMLPLPEARAKLAWAAAWLLVIGAGAYNLRFTWKEFHGLNGHGDLAGTYHPDLGKFLVRHERPGGLVAFQDMGSTPYHAPDLAFLDFFGLVDSTVAHARHDHGLHTFIASNDTDAEAKFDAEMREYFFRRDPEWTILTVYVPPGEQQRIKGELDADPTGNGLGDAFSYNRFQFGLWSDPRFQQRYVAVRTWPRSVAYYLGLFRRRDLWEKTPREVVLEDAPPDIGGAKATFEGDLELLGSELAPTVTVERHEVFVTTWWKLPGPMPHDLYFFVHVVGRRSQVPADHVPGDWMWPADRWRKGQVLEDRILFQLPPFVMRPGTYDVYVGAYRRSTGERLKVLAGAADAEGRVRVGSFEARSFRPMLDQLIPPTHVEVMRKYPGRIVER